MHMQSFALVGTMEWCNAYVRSILLVLSQGFLGDQLVSQVSSIDQVRNNLLYRSSGYPIHNVLPGKISSPFWCTVPLQHVYKWLNTQAWVTTDIV